MVYGSSLASEVLPSHLEGAERERYFDQVVRPAIEKFDRVILVIFNKKLAGMVSGEGSVVDYYRAYFGKNGYSWADQNDGLVRVSVAVKATEPRLPHVDKVLMETQVR